MGHTTLPKMEWENNILGARPKVRGMFRSIDHILC